MIPPQEELRTAAVCTYIWFIQQTHDEAEGSEVSRHILRFALHILLTQDVNQCLKSQK